MRGPRRRRSRRYVNRNRQWGARQNTFSISLRSSAALIAVVAVAVMYLVSVQARDAVQDEIQREEQRSLRLQEEFQRENADWSRMRTPRTLAQALASHGVSMAPPRASQRVAMSGRRTLPGDGSPGGVYAVNR